MSDRPLSSLAPKWIQPSNWADAAPPFYVGLTFDCPAHAICPTCGRGAHRVAVNFQPPIDVGNVIAQWGDEWAKFARAGHHRTSGTLSSDSFETLTLAPSVQIDGHFHGMITNGVVTLV